MRVIFSLLTLAGAFASTANAGEIWVTMDQVTPYELEVPAGEIIIGNSGIADVTATDKSRLLLFGKSPGVTNLFIFDDEGNKVDNLIVSVRAIGNQMMTVHKGAARTTLTCTNLCEQTVTVGDDQGAFASTAGQIQTKFSTATSN